MSDTASPALPEDIQKNIDAYDGNEKRVAAIGNATMAAGVAGVGWQAFKAIKSCQGLMGGVRVGGPFLAGLLGAGLARWLGTGEYVASRIAPMLGLDFLPGDGPLPATQGFRIAHNKSSWLSKVGAFIGGAALVIGVAALTIGTGGAALPVLGAALVGGGTVTTCIVGFLGGAAIMTATDAAARLGSPSGTIKEGSSNVTFAGKPVARVGDALECNCGAEKNAIRQGTKTVSVNSRPLARIGHLALCSAVIMDGVKSITASTDTATYGTGDADISTGQAIASGLIAAGNAKLLAKFLRVVRGEPVDVATGEYADYRTDFVFPGILPLELKRAYVGRGKVQGLLGSKWMCNWSQRLWFDKRGTTLTFEEEEGQSLTFFLNGPEYNSTHPEISNYRLSGTRRFTRIFNTLTQQTLVFEPAESEPRCSLLSAIEDRNGNRIEFIYDNDHLSIIRLSDGELFIATTDERGLLKTLIRKADGKKLLSYAYDHGGNLTAVHSLFRGVFRYGYTKQGWLNHWSDSGVTRFDLTYDRYGRVTATTSPSGLYNDRFNYYPKEQRTEYIDATGARQTFWYNLHRLVTREEDALGNITTHEWDSKKRKVSTTDALGRETRFAHDASGQLQEEVDWAGRATSYAYNAHGQLENVRLPDGLAQTWAYDEYGNVTAITGFDGGVTRFTYDGAGRIASVDDAINGLRTFAYDVSGRLKGTVDVSGAATSFEIDAYGRVRRICDAGGHETRYDYDASATNLREDVSAVTHPDGGVERFKYDAEGLLAQHYEPSGQDTRREYGALDLLHSITDAGGGKTRFGYDGAARLTTVMNAIGQTWRYAYDGAGRVIAEKDFAGRETRYAHDAVGRVIGRKRPDGEEQFVEWDERDRVIAITTPHQALRYSYDDNDRLIRAVTECKGETETELILVYDAKGRVIREIQDGAEVDYRYDEAGRIVGRASGSGEASYGFDPRGFLSELTSNGHGLRFGRNILGQETSREGSGGFALGQSYDPCGRLTEQRVGVTLDGRIDRASVDGFTRRYEWDKSGRLKGIGDPTRGETRYTYDYRDQVLRVERPQSKGGWNAGEYRYDLLMNLERSDQGAHAYDQAREVTQAGPVSYQRDELGRVTSRTVSRNGFRPQTWHYEWDGFDRLISVRTPDGSLWRYTYDVFGRRVRKECVTVGRESATRFLWQGARLAEEWKNDTTSRWHYEPGTFVPVAKEVVLVGSASSRFYPVVADHLGTVQEVFDERGVCQWRAEQSLWGRTRGQWRDRDAEAFGEAGCNLRFQGQYEDDESGLFYNLHRYYDPDAGMYLSNDPIGLEGGLRPQGYVHSPTGWIDPWGLARSSTSGNSSAAARGQRAHIAYRNTLGDTGYEFEWTLDNGDRVDAINTEKRIVRELKPDNPRAMARGRAQLARYVAQLEKQTNKKWTGILDTYKSCK